MRVSFDPLLPRRLLLIVSHGNRIGFALARFSFTKTLTRIVKLKHWQLPQWFCTATHPSQQGNPPGWKMKCHHVTVASGCLVAKMHLKHYRSLSSFQKCNATNPKLNASVIMLLSLVEVARLECRCNKSEDRCIQETAQALLIEHTP